jgi:hypothetical protein
MQGCLAVSRRRIMKSIRLPNDAITARSCVPLRPKRPVGACRKRPRYTRDSDKTLDTIIHRAVIRWPLECYKSPSEAIMVKHSGISRSHVYSMLASKDARVRRAAFTLLEASNPRLRRNSELFIEIVRFIWDANPSYDVYREFSKRHLFVPQYGVHNESNRAPVPIGAPNARARADF